MMDLQLDRCLGGDLERSENFVVAGMKLKKLHGKCACIWLCARIWLSAVIMPALVGLAFYPVILCWEWICN